MGNGNGRWQWQVAQACQFSKLNFRPGRARGSSERAFKLGQAADAQASEGGQQTLMAHDEPKLK